MPAHTFGWISRSPSPAAVQLGHAPLALGLRAAEVGLRRPRSRPGPCRPAAASATAHASSAVGRAITWKRMPKRERPPVPRRRARATRSTRSATIARRLAPRQVDVGLLAAATCSAAADAPAEVHRRAPGRARRGSWRPRPGSAARRGRTARRSHAPRMIVDELAGALVAGVLVGEVAEPGRSAARRRSRGSAAAGRRTAAGRSTAICAARVGDSSPGRKATRNLHPLGERDQRGGGQPGVLAPGAARGQHPVEPELGGPRHLRHVGNRRRPSTGRRRRLDITDADDLRRRRAVQRDRPIQRLRSRPRLDQSAAIAMRREVPVKRDRFHTSQCTSF